MAQLEPNIPNFTPEPPKKEKWLLRALRFVAVEVAVAVALNQKGIKGIEEKQKLVKNIKDFINGL